MPTFVWAVMHAESRGNHNATSHKNARGLMQVIPPTAARMGVNPKHLYDPEQNIIAGTRYLRFLSNRFKGNFELHRCSLQRRRRRGRSVSRHSAVS